MTEPSDLPDNPLSTDRAENPELGTDSLDFLIVMARHKRMIATVTFGAAILAAVISLLLPDIYTGKAVVMPPQQDQSTASVLIGQITGGGGIGSSGGGSIQDALGLKSVNDLYVGLLKSRTIADRLIERFKLKELYEKDTLVQTRVKLGDKSTFTAGKDGLITVEFDDYDPKRAADVANAYVEELDKVTRGLAITQASQQRVYYEMQLAKAKEGLTKAEGELKRVQQETGILKLDDQAKPIFEAMATIRGLIASKEVEISGIKAFATEKNADLIQAREVLAGLQKQLALLQRNSVVGDGDILVPTGRIPELGLQYLRKLRDVTYYDTLYQALAKQYEIARIEAGKTATVIQLVDKAVVLDRKTKPIRSLIVIVTAFVAGILAIMAASVLEKLERIRQDPVGAEKMRLLREYSKWKRA